MSSNLPTFESNLIYDLGKSSCHKRNDIIVTYSRVGLFKELKELI